MYKGNQGICMKYIVLGTTAFTKHLAQAIIDSKETVSLLITLNDNLYQTIQQILNLFVINII